MLYVYSRLGRYVVDGIEGEHRKIWLKSVSKVQRGEIKVFRKNWYTWLIIYCWFVIFVLGQFWGWVLILQLQPVPVPCMLFTGLY